MATTRTPDQGRLIATAARELADAWMDAEMVTRREFPVADAEEIIAEAELIAARRRIADSRKWRIALRNGHIDEDQRKDIG